MPFILASYTLDNIVLVTCRNIFAVIVYFTHEHDSYIILMLMMHADGAVMMMMVMIIIMFYASYLCEEMHLDSQYRTSHSHVRCPFLMDHLTIHT